MGTTKDGNIADAFNVKDGRMDLRLVVDGGEKEMRQALEAFACAGDVTQTTPNTFTLRLPINDLMLVLDDLRQGNVTLDPEYLLFQLSRLLDRKEQAVKP